MSSKTMAMGLALGLAGLMTAGTASAFRSENGIGLNGRSTQGINLNGRSSQGISLNGVQLNGVTLNGARVNGRSMQGIGLNGRSWQGCSFQGANSSVMQPTDTAGDAWSNVRLDAVAVRLPPQR